MDCYKALGLF